MLRASLFLTISIAVAAHAFAHHGFGTFDLSKTVTFPNATLTRVELINPHSWLYFEVIDEDGETSQHRCEMRSAHVLRRSGWTPDLFPTGSQMNLTASPDRRDPNSCYLQTIEFASGTRMDRYGQYVRAPDGELREVRGPIATPETRTRGYRRPLGEPNITGDWAPEQRVMADARGIGGGLVPLGDLDEIDAGAEPERTGGGRRGGGPNAGPRLYGGTELTPRGEREAANFTREDNPRFQCETTSVLFDWTFDGPVNRIAQTSDRIIIRYGQMGLDRIVHMNMRQHPADIERSRAGHSIGWWEEDVLVVDTVGFLPGVLNAPVRHSDQLHVIERFSLDPETFALTRSYVAEDPVYLKGPYTGSDVVNPADARYTEDNCKEQAFIDFSEVAGSE